MASESHDKHRRSLSSEDNAERSLKRHKHRHHRRHHRHRSKKHEEETKLEGGDINCATPPPVVISNFCPDDVVEEGEILEEEEGFGGGERVIAERKSESDEESKEIVTFGVPSQLDQRSLVSSDCPYLLVFFIITFNFLSVWLLRKLRNLRFLINFLWRFLKGKFAFGLFE